MDYIEGTNRDQAVLFPASLDEYITGENPVRPIDAFVDSLDLQALDFTHAMLNETGRPPYHPAVLLSSTSMATSTASDPAVPWSGRRAAMWKSCG